jgi:hypothetical protein
LVPKLFQNAQLVALLPLPQSGIGSAALHGSQQVLHGEALWTQSTAHSCTNVTSNAW